jgi:hypothetical protein
MGQAAASGGWGAIDFLLKNAGPVIQYRLHKEILKDISEGDAAKYLEAIYQTPHYKMLLRSVKPTSVVNRRLPCAHGLWR